MKVAIYLDGTKHGGVDTHLLNLLQNWPNSDDRFTIFSNRNNEGLIRTINEFKKIPNLQIFYYLSFRSKSRCFLCFLLEPIRFFIEILRGCFLLKKEKFQVLLSDNGGFPGASSCLAIIFSAYLLGIPKRILLIHHAASPQIPVLNFWRSIRDIGLQHCSTELVTVSLATRDTLVERRYFKTMLNPIRVIHNGFTPSNIQYKQELNLREKYLIDENQYILGILGRVERYKGQEDLIIAMSRLPNNYRERLIVFIVGGGEDVELKRLYLMVKKYNLEDRIFFTGFVDCRSVEIVVCFDLLLMLTKDFEAFNYTIAEAMTMNVPTIITNVGAISEYYNCEIAKIIPPESPDLIAEALIEFVNKPSKFQKMARKAKEHIKNFNAKKMAINFYDLMT